MQVHLQFYTKKLNRIDLHLVILLKFHLKNFQLNSSSGHVSERMLKTLIE